LGEFKKFELRDSDHLIELMASFNATKAIVQENIQKYGLEDEEDYILSSLGIAPTKKVELSDRVQEQAQLFDFIFDTKRDCYVRIRNKYSGRHYTYNVKALKNPHKLQNILDKGELFRENIDLMYSLNTYNNMHRADNDSIFSIHLIAIDLDPDLSERTVDRWIDLVELEVLNGKIPAPSFIEYGHRLRLMYKVESVGATKKSKNLSQKIANKLAAKLDPEFNATGQALTTYGRIVGSVNSKDMSLVQVKWVHKSMYQLRDLQKDVLGPPEWLVSAGKEHSKVIRLKTPYSLNRERMNDLWRIQKIRDEGYREMLCFMFRNHCILAGYSQEEAKEAMLEFNANFERPLKPNKVEQDTRNVNKRQYLLRNEWIINNLHITPEEEEYLNCVTIISKAEKKRRNNVYNKKEYQENKVELNEKAKERYRKKNPVSKKTKKQEEIEKIKDLLAEGLTGKQIANTLAVSLRTVRSRIKDMKDEGLI
jgi:hypothetical protein